jgi:hypothetical protein
MRPLRLFIPMIVVFALVAVTPAGLSAQEAKVDSVTRARVDSLQVRIRKLEARLDSLLAAMAQGAPMDSAARAATDELEVLRAAARAAAAEQEPADTTGQGSRTGDLSALNPEISLTGDILGEYLAPAGGDAFFTAVPREFELGFQAALDPYTRTKVFIAYEQEYPIAGYPSFNGEEGEDGHLHSHIHVEEGYLYWVGLPANLGLKVGSFREQIGLYNRWHRHALLEVDYPLAMVAFLGRDGLIGTGISFVPPVLTLGPSTNTLTLEVARASHQPLFDDSKRLSFLGNFQNFWDLSPASYIQFEVTGVYGKNNDEALTSRLLEFDVLYRWRPPGRSRYRDLRVAVEYYFAEKDYGDTVRKGNGGYVQANYRLNRSWIAGLRTDYLNYYGNDPDVYQIVPTLTWWQSEFVYVRAQYNYLKPDGGGANHTVILQVVWAMGPHKHEAY